MKSIYIRLLFIFIISVSRSFSQTTWTLRNPTPLPGSSFRFMHFPDTNKVFGITGFNSGLQSTNGGLTWQRTSIYDSLSYLQSTDFPTKDIGYSVFLRYEAGMFEGFYLAKSTNGGTSWQSKKLNQEIFMISFPNNTIGYGLGIDSLKRFYKTIDGGLNWMEMPLTVTGKNKQQILAVSESALIYLADDKLFRSTDGGQSWSQRPTGITRSNPGNDRGSNPIYKNPSSGILYYFGINNKIARSLDTGKTWTVSVIPNPQILNIENVCFFDALSGFAFSKTWLTKSINLLHKTTDGGVTWVPFTSNLNQFETSNRIAFANRNVGYAFGSIYNILKTTDGGTIWKNLIKDFKGTYKQGCFQNKSSAWAITDSGYLWHSHNKGKSWEYQKLIPNMVPGGSSYLNSVDFPHPLFGYVTGEKLWKTTNGGLSWNILDITVPGIGNLNGFWFPNFINKDTGFVYGPGQRLLKTTNGGEDWNVVFQFPQVPGATSPFYLFNLKFIEYRKGFAFFYSYSNSKHFLRIYKTINGGETWDTLTSPIPGMQVYENGVSIADSLHLFIKRGSHNFPDINNTSGLHISKDGGKTWTVKKSYVSIRSDLLKFVSPNKGYAVVPNEGLYQTLDTGNTWNLISRDLDFAFFRNLLFYNNKPVLAFGRGIYTADEWAGKDPLVAIGRIVKKENQDCIQDQNEIGLANRFLEVAPGPYYASTILDGRFEVNIQDTGSYTLKQIPYSPTLSILESQFCPLANASIPLNFNGQIDTISQNNFINNVKPCPILKINQIHSFARPCRQGRLDLAIENQGNLTSDSEYVHIKLPKYLHLFSANYLFDYNAIDSTFRFKIKPLQTSESIRILITDSISCIPSLQGQTLCVKATIPNAPNCLLQSPNWDGADLEVASSCLASGQSRFKIQNKGAAMSQTAQYQIFIDSALVYQAPFQLAANGAMSVTLPTNAPAGFARLVVPQSANHPLSTFASAEANCATGISTNGLFPPPDQSPLVDIECVTVTNAYDPNDKQVFPKGWGAAGNVQPETEFKYTIRFQNTGTDTAFKVVLVDTLDQNLDIASLQIGNASHPFTFKVSGKGRPVLTWTFDNILLPDSGRNMDASNGFVSFSIRPKTGLALGTRLENFADIYFDFNDPIRTNTTVNTLWVPTLTTGVLDTVFVTEAKKSITVKSFKISPNPAVDLIAIEFPERNTSVLEITDLQGKRIKQLQIISEKAVSIKDLKPGIYIMKLEGYRAERLVVKP